MEEIKVGQYIRTKSGRFAQITTINNVRYTAYGAKIRKKEELIGKERLLINGKYELEDIKNIAKEVINLIEVGDYVNGHLVIAVDREKLEASIENCMYGSDYEDINGNIDIKSIVTKEQFKSMEYEVDKCK